MADPVRAKRGPVSVVAWRDTDRPLDGSRVLPAFFLEVRMKDWPPLEVTSLSPNRIKALAEALLDVHSQVTATRGPMRGPKKRSA